MDKMRTMLCIVKVQNSEFLEYETAVDEADIHKSHKKCHISYL